MSTETPINDVMLTDGWYRIFSSNGDDMPTEAPNAMKCGTWYPIWLNDTLPLATDDIVSKKVCLRSFKFECSESWNIDIKNCSSFFVYNLVSSITENSAYCFGSKPVQCPYGFSSETGFYPNCSMDFPDKTITKAEVIVDLVPGPVILLPFGFSLSTAFTCKFNEVFGDDGGEFLYDVQWFINGQSFILHTGISYSNIGSTNLTENDWIGKHTLNMIVRCSVRLRYNVGLTPGHEVNSASFSAGIYHEKYEYQVAEKEEIEIKLFNSMPVGCVGHKDTDRKGCVYKLRLAQPGYQVKCKEENDCGICKGTVQEGDLSFERADCSYNVTSATWDQPLILKVTGYINGQYDFKDRTTYLRVLSQEKNFYIDGDNFAWDNVVIPDIKILVSDGEKQLSGRVCESFNDPHFYTADKYRWDNYKPGEYILYRHKTKPYQVNALYGLCNVAASCNCGVAIRSGHSMFVMRTCDYIAQYETRTHSPTIEMRSCDDSSMIIKENGGIYTVTLPIGTEIKFSTPSGWGHEHFIGYIHVKPSILDVENSEGLCGYVSSGSKDTSDDFTLRDGTIIDTTEDNWETFAEEWRVRDNERFFLDHPIALSQEIHLQQYCICGEEKDTPGTSLNEFAYKCGLEGPLQNCLAQTADAGNFHTTCSSSRRKRSVDGHHIITKSLTDSDDIIDNREIYIAPDSELSAVETKHNDEWPGDWTEIKAREVCQSRITKSITDEILETSHTQSDGYIDTCMFDIRLAGDTRFLETTISSLQEVAISEISRNMSLFIKENTTENENGTTSNTKKSIGEMLLGGLCSNNCSNNGVCQKGVCICNHGFGKQDCSEDLTLPPRNITVPMNGICNTRDRLCAKTNIQGVFNSRNITCRSRHMEILKDGSWSYISDYQTYDGQYRNSYLVSCALPTARRKKRSISESVIADGYEISLSTDGNNFGDSVKIMIYDLECFSCYMENNTCTQLDTCPIETTTESTTEYVSTNVPPVTTTKSKTFNSETSMTPRELTSTTRSSITLMATESMSSEYKTDGSNTSTPKNESTESNNIAAILGSLIGVVLIIVLVLSGMIYYKTKLRKNGHIEDNLMYQCQVPPKQTAMKPQFSDQYHREKSNNSLGNLSLNLETDNISRSRTPVELFSVGNN
ncbi:von Willebrand factor D and EGF domain-containing protein-like [Mytilus galloprovincialis]|uniref:von Willebrand factor D and EGF domain-containing protein-like n=1 Tax=Mytilus galloprovincialis TaxID=29158 RepID=UPI003F7C22BA